MQVEAEKTLIDRIPAGIAIFESEGEHLSLRFLNEGYYTMMGYGPGDCRPALEEETTASIHPGDLPHLAAAVRLAIQRGGTFSEIVRIYSRALGRYKSVCVNAALTLREPGSFVFYASLDDVDGLMHTHEKLTEEQTALNMAVAAAGLRYFEYDPARHTARRPAGFYADGKATIWENFPESYLCACVPDAEQAETMRAAFQRIDAGSRQESFSIYQQKNGHGRWYSYHLSSIYGLDGTRRKVACTAFDITSQREAALTYRHHMQAVMRMNPDAISTFRLNLTQNACEYGASDYPNILTLQDKGTADGYRTDALSFIPSAKDKKRYGELFQRENMLKLFASGHKTLSLTHSYEVCPGNLRLITTKVDMMQSPATGDVEAIIYAIDATRNYLENALEKQLLEKEFEKILLVDMDKGRCLFYQFSEEKADRQFEVSYSYEEQRQWMAEKRVHPGEKKKFLARTEPAYVRGQLEKGGEYFFTIYGKGKDSRRLRKITYRYLNKENHIMLATVQDLTRVMDWDLLTGAFNRSGFANFVEPILKKRNEQERYAILFFNIRGFKAINEIFGVEGGDSVLRETLEILRNSTLQPLAIARLEADHFVCLIRQENLDYNEIARICNRTYKKNRKQIRFYGRCGIYLVGRQQHTVSGMCDRAKLAKEYITDGYVKPYALYDSSMREAFVAQRQLTGELERALANQEFLVYYQPVYDTKKRKIVSAEALVRWQHPKRGILSPGLFVPAFEESGYISELDLFVARTAKHFLEERNRRNAFTVPVAINLSRMDFYDNHIMDTLLADLENSTLPEDSIRFEITESAYAAVADDAVEVIDAMRAHKARILIDDFGSGYSSFSAIRDFRFDYLKLDMGFVRNIGNNQKTEWIIRAIIEMAHNMGTKVIAEGVETDEQLNFLESQGCDYIQGYYFSRPLPEQAFCALLDECETQADEAVEIK